MELIDEIKTIDFYLYGIDRRIRKSFLLGKDENGDQLFYFMTNGVDTIKYHESLDAIAPVIRKIHEDNDGQDEELRFKIGALMYVLNGYFITEAPMGILMACIIDCIEYINKIKTKN